MKNISTDSLDAPGGETQVPLYLTTKPHQESKLWQWWYRVASPPTPRSSASFQEMERFRRGRIGSQIILALYLLFIISIPAGFVGTNEYLIPIVIGTCCTLALGTVFNRMGQVNVAGIIVVLTAMAFPIASIVTTPGGLSMLVLPLYGLFILPLLCTVSFLPPWWVFVVALGNCLFSLLSLLSLPPPLSLPHTAELVAILNIAFAGIITPIVLSQIIVSVVAYTWVQSSTQALIRADRAEELAKLEHDMALQAEEAARQKIQLEVSIQKIVETHMRVANGEFNARVPLTQDNILWQISGALNNLLARAQGWRQDAAELQKVKHTLQQARDENGRLVRELGKDVNRGPHSQYRLNNDRG